MGVSMKRIAISKKIRFEIFKRDGFVCHYCGAHPPQVILQVDHIVPVKGDGPNDMDNLVTSCQPCNIGKGARSLSAIPQTLSAKAKIIAEREAQLLGYQEIMDSRRDRIEDEMWRVAEVIQPGSSESGMSRDWLGGIKRFNADLGVNEVLDAAERALDRVSRCGTKSVFRYFCAICWGKIREAQKA